MSTTVDIPAMADQEVKRHQVCGTWASRRIDSDGCTAPLSHELCIRLDALAAERDRLREALEAVTQQLEHSFTPWPDATIDALRLARAAFAPGTPVDLE